MSRVTVDTTLDRTTDFTDEGGTLTFDTSSTNGVTISRVFVDDQELRDVPEELYERIMDALYDEGFTS